MAKVPFRISARATILLGREGVSKADGALVELIKNTYDADAEICFICIDRENDMIILFDNGIGMDMQTIKDYWMLIGTANKKDDYESQKKRIKSGEKGIGRFALDRLGNKCVMYTKMQNTSRVLRWSTDWSEFENTDKTLDKMEADLEEIDGSMKSYLPGRLVNNICAFVNGLNKQRTSPLSVFDNGTIFIISGLRDEWSSVAINKIFGNLNTLLPPEEQTDFFLCTMNSLDSDYEQVSSAVFEDFDYKMLANFDGNKFVIEICRNEFDLNKIPMAVFERKEFQEFPYKRTNFEEKSFKKEYSIQELLKTDDNILLQKVKSIGTFSFHYNFMKLTMADDSKEIFFYKEIGKRRKQWLEEFGGIKIYRDNFFVRPYGMPGSESFDWLGLDARRAKNPAAISHENGGWHVRNMQSQGTILISRINNQVLLDKSSREGIIENEYFTVFKNVIIALISVFERDRAYIGRAMKLYSDEINEKQRTKEEGKKAAEEVLGNAKKKNDSSALTNEEKLAKAVMVYEEEKEELLTEIQQLRSLATNGLITSTIAHDLKGINAILVTRVESLRKEINRKREDAIDRQINDLLKNDRFLKSWLTVVTVQARKDKRTRKKYDLCVLFKNIISVLEPILERKKINVSVNTKNQIVERKVFRSDFESILYNLIINSIEAFEKCSKSERIICVELDMDDDNIVISYKDNGPGLAAIFDNPYEIFQYGTTSKLDKDGNPIGTGMGMYIVASTLREYNSTPVILESKNGFELSMKMRR